MIKNFRHKGLKALYENNDRSGVKQDQVIRIRSLLARLDSSRIASDMDLPGLRLHQLQGDLRGFYSVVVSGNWRFIFRFDKDGNSTDVDLIDYH